MSDLTPRPSSEILDEHVSRVAKAALLLRRQGMSMFDIAEELQLPESECREAIKKGMAKAAQLVSDAAKSELLALEVTRLDALQQAVWPAAMSGDTRSVDAALKVINQRAKLLGLEETTVDNRNQTVVVAGDSKTYLEALRSVATYREG